MRSTVPGEEVGACTRWEKWGPGEGEEVERGQEGEGVEGPLLPISLQNLRQEGHGQRGLGRAGSLCVLFRVKAMGSGTDERVEQELGAES